METSKKKLGNLGEDLACDYLTGMGHTILDRNWRSRHLEIDIISMDSSGLHFVEVKSRTAPVVADPEQNVTWLKQRKITNAALSYLNGRNFGNLEVYFDVVAVVFDKENVTVNYYKQAFIPIYD